MKVPRVHRWPLHRKKEIEARLIAGDFESYRTFAKELKSRGLRISKSALQAHRARLLKARPQR